MKSAVKSVLLSNSTTRASSLRNVLTAVAAKGSSPLKAVTLSGTTSAGPLLRSKLGNAANAAATPVLPSGATIPTAAAVALSSNSLAQLTTRLEGIERLIAQLHSYTTIPSLQSRAPDSRVLPATDLTATQAAVLGYAVQVSSSLNDLLAPAQSIAVSAAASIPSTALFHWAADSRTLFLHVDCLRDAGDVLSVLLHGIALACLGKDDAHAHAAVFRAFAQVTFQRGS